MTAADNQAKQTNRAMPPQERAPDGGPRSTPSLDRVARQAAERDRDAAESSRDRFSFLAEASRCLADSLDYETTLTPVAGMALPYLDAWCIVDVVTPAAGGTEIRRLAVLHPDPHKRELARRLYEE